MKIAVGPSKNFIKNLDSLPPDRQALAIDTLEKFKKNPSNRSLRFRRLKGQDGYFILSASHGDRIILRKDAPDTYTAVDVGPHDNIYRRWDR